MYPNVYGPPWFKTGNDGWEYRKGVDAWMISYMGNLNELVELYKEFEDVVRNEKYRRSQYIKARLLVLTTFILNDNA